MDGRKDDVQTPLAALLKALGEDGGLYAAGLRNSRDTGRDGFADALQKTRAADVVLMFLGEEQILSGEAHSRAFLDLPGSQEALLDQIANAGKPILVVIIAGRPLTFHSVAAKGESRSLRLASRNHGRPRYRRSPSGQRCSFRRIGYDFPAHGRTGADLLCTSQYRPAGSAEPPSVMGFLSLRSNTQIYASPRRCCAIQGASLFPRKSQTPARWKPTRSRNSIFIRTLPGSAGRCGN